MTYWADAKEFPERLVPKGPFLGSPPIAIDTLAYRSNGLDHAIHSQYQEAVDQLVRHTWAVQEIAVIRVVAQHPWAWDLIGITRWARQRRSNP